MSEPGEAELRLCGDQYSLEARGSGCVLHVWGEQGNVVRRVAAVGDARRGRLPLRIRRFGGAEGKAELVDQARAPAGAGRRVDLNRFRERLRRILLREWPAWKPVRLTAAADLQRSLSPRYVRGTLQRGADALAVVAAPPEAPPDVADAALTQGLLWLEQVRAADRRRVCGGLRLILPAGQTATTAARLRFIRRSALRFELYALDRQGRLTAVDPHDWGALASELPAWREPASLAPAVERRLARFLAQVELELVPRPDGSQSLRVRGLELGRVMRGSIAFGLDRLETLTDRGVDDALRLVREVLRLRSADPPDPSGPLYRTRPERWLESQVRRSLPALDSTLAPGPIYSGVPTRLGAEHGVVDLLAQDRDGRLVALELKAEEDIELPLQALDYWLRVERHLERGDFGASGYFRGRPIASHSPRLLLVAPALKFHPTTETILRYLSPEIPFERIGLGSDWQRRLEVVFRARGAARLDQREW